MAEEMASSAGQIHPIIEVDEEAVENDPTSYGDELSTYTASLTSSVYDYRRENGRRYHGYHDGVYLLPNDKAEDDRLAIMHEMTMTIMHQRLHLAPLRESPPHALDLGTGTGIWAIDFGDRYPTSQVLGVDLSPNQPSMVPPNVSFIIDDIEQQWVYDKPFNFIHARYLAGSVKDYKGLLKQAYDNTSPGGWVEFQDWETRLHSEDESTKGTNIEKYYDTMIPAFEKAGYEANPGPKLEDWFREVGFEGVQVKRYQVPLGGWPKDGHMKKIGLWNLLQVETGFEAGAMAVLTRCEGWSRDEVNVLVRRAKDDARDRNIHSLFYFYVVYGRKPRESQ